MEITAITSEHELWQRTICFASGCSWRGGHYLSDAMRNGSFHGWERVFVAVDNGQIAGFCTLTEKDEMSEKYDFRPFIGSVFVDEFYRGSRLSGKLIDEVSHYASKYGFEKVYIMSGEVGLYEKYGFTFFGMYDTIYGSVEQLFVRNT